MDKLKMQSENLVDENIEKIAKLFPNCITEGKDENGQVVRLVDFDLLKQELSKEIVEGNDERYTLNWAGKKQAILTANSPINATLRPCREESVDFDNTKNIYIEGDNLDVLKLLRETYMGKINIIYIDPPYNTGNDFIYEDNFATSVDEYLLNSLSYDKQGNMMFANNDTNGRFHSDWLSMIYVRLKLARDLLSDNGMICVSIDDHELDNLKKVCNEIYGEKNYLGLIARATGTTTGQDADILGNSLDYCLCYTKNAIDFELGGLELSEEDKKRFNMSDEKGMYSILQMRKTGTNDRREDRPFLYYSVKAPDGTDVFPIGPTGYDSCWRVGPSTFEELKKNDMIVWKQMDRSFSAEKTWIPYIKYYLEGRTKKPSNLWTNIDGNKKGSIELKELLNEKNIFSNPKPIQFVKNIINLKNNNKNDLILDFFSGSSTTANAILDMNADDGGNRQFIMVQLPELCDEKSEAYKAGYKNICEIGKERIRRAGKKIKDDIESSKLLFQNKDKVNTQSNEFKNAMQTAIDNLQNDNFESLYLEEKKVPDIGFRVLKLDSSNMKDVYYNPSELKQSNLFDLTSNIKEDRSAEDLLFQVMLDMGVMLSSEIKTIDIKGKKVFNVNDGNLVCCFDKNLTDDVVTQIAKMQPLYAVFRDSSMSTDSVAVNFDQIFETYSPTTTRKVL